MVWQGVLAGDISYKCNLDAYTANPMNAGEKNVWPDNLKLFWKPCNSYNDVLILLLLIKLDEYILKVLVILI